MRLSGLRHERRGSPGASGSRQVLLPDLSDAAAAEEHRRARDQAEQEYARTLTAKDDADEVSSERSSTGSAVRRHNEVDASVTHPARAPRIFIRTTAEGYSRGTTMIHPTVSTMHATTIGFRDRPRIEMIALLNSRLAESLDLGPAGTARAWNIRGSQFIVLHDLFARLYGDLDRYSDLLAERAVQLGGMAEGTIRGVDTRSSLPTYPFAVEGSEHGRWIAAALASWAVVLRGSIGPATELGDPVTADILTDVSLGVDKWLWLVEANIASV